MSVEQKRWTCHDCKRQWVDAEPPGTGLSQGIGVLYQPDPVKKPDVWNQRSWEPERDGCRGCGSKHIELVEYRPEFSGADIPTGAMTKNVEPVKAPEVMPTPLPLVAAETEASSDAWQQFI